MNPTLTKPSKILLLILLISSVCINLQCKSASSRTDLNPTPPLIKAILHDGSELYTPKNKTNATLILFGGFPESPSDIKREFNIIDKALENNIAVLFMNFNQKLWLTNNDEYELANNMQSILVKYNLDLTNIYIGGFSSGGIVSLLISDFVTESKDFYWNPAGVFIIDSPIDLEALYKASQKNIARNFSEISVNESTFLIETFEYNFGSPKDFIETYEKHSVYTHSTENTSNLSHLKHIKMRLYTEPDTTWWKENRRADQDQMNAFYIEKLYLNLKNNGFTSVDYIPTMNRGYRANGERHPHSWSIVDQNDLIHWILQD